MANEVKAIFITDEYGPTILFDDKGLIGEFKPTHSNLKKGMDDGILRRIGHDLCVMVLKNQDLIDRAKAYPGYGAKFKETDTEPVYYTLNNLSTKSAPGAGEGVNVQAAAMELAKEQMKAEREQNAADMRRYGQLFSQICKAGGDYVTNADPQLIAEFENLQKKLGIKENEKDELYA